MVLLYLVKISFSFRNKKNWQRVLSPSIETSMTKLIVMNSYRNFELWMLSIIKVSILFGKKKTKSAYLEFKVFPMRVSFRLDWSTSDWVLLCTWMIDKVLTVFISVAQRVSSVLGQSVGHMHRPCSQCAPCLQLMPLHKSVK